MTNEEFAALINRLEQSAKLNPDAYRFRVVLLAIAGNAYLAFILLVMFALLVGALASILVLKALAVKIIVPVAILLWAILKSLWVTVPDPQGLEVTRHDAPELHRLIDSLRKQATAPRFHRVLMNNEFNAAVAQRPRFGLFGGYRNYLLIGLPLMKMLTVEQFTAVLAHEFGHLAKGHGRASSWIYRQRMRWAQLMEWFEETGNKGSILFTPFLNRFAPYFNAYSFPLARADEYQADAASVSASSAAVTAEMLTAVHVVGSYLHEQYWPAIYRQADEVAQPSLAPYQGMLGHLPAELPRDSIERWLARAMQEETALSDTHPCLKERLAAIGEEPRFAPPAKGTSAESLLGPALERITKEFDHQWLANVEEGWKNRYEEVSEGRKNLAELEEKLAKGEELSPQEGYDRALLTEQYGAGNEEALRQFEALQQRLPEDAVVNYALGVRWLNNDDERGVARMEFAMERDAELYVSGAEVLRDYCWRKGREEEAHRWHERLVQRAEEDRQAAKERDDIFISDSFEPHQLSGDALDQLLGQLKAIPGLGKVYLVRKVVKFHPERPLHVLGFTTKFSLRQKQRRTEIQRQIVDEVSFPSQALIVCVDEGNKQFGRKFSRVKGARIM